MPSICIMTFFGLLPTTNFTIIRNSLEMIFKIHLSSHKSSIFRVPERVNFKFIDTVHNLAKLMLCL